VEKVNGTATLADLLMVGLDTLIQVLKLTLVDHAKITVDHVPDKKSAIVAILDTISGLMDQSEDVEIYVLHAKPTLQAQFQLLIAQLAKQGTELIMGSARSAQPTVTSVQITNVMFAKMDTSQLNLDHVLFVPTTVYSAQVLHHHVLLVAQDSI